MYVQPQQQKGVSIVELIYRVQVTSRSRSFITSEIIIKSCHIFRTVAGEKKKKKKAMQESIKP